MIFVENISGWTQDEGSNGTIDLNEKILAAVDDYSPLVVRVRPRRWNENWKAIAISYYYLRKKYPKPEPFTIIVNAYSYGAGHGLTSLAKQLNRFNLQIQLANICDGVYCHWHPLGWWRAIVGHSQILLPPNIVAYHGFYQRKNVPHGREILGTNTKRLSWTELFAEHEYMDDDDEWQNHCVKTVLEQVKRSVKTVKVMPRGAPISEATESRLAN